MFRQIIEGQKRELTLTFKQNYVVRRVGAPSLDNQLIKVVIGPRRAGKSFTPNILLLHPEHSAISILMTSD